MLVNYPVNVLENGYSQIEELLTITNHELQSLIPQILVRKKFAASLVGWLVEKDVEVADDILLVIIWHYLLSLLLVNEVTEMVL